MGGTGSGTTLFCTACSRKERMRVFFDEIRSGLFVMCDAKNDAGVWVPLGTARLDLSLLGARSTVGDFRCEFGFDLMQIVARCLEFYAPSAMWSIFLLSQPTVLN